MVTSLHKFFFGAWAVTLAAFLLWLFTVGVNA